MQKKLNEFSVGEKGTVVRIEGEEEVGMGGPPLGHLAAESLGNMLLADDVGEGLGPPLSIEGLIHRLTSENRCSTCQ